jgi:hypothetical protein
VSGRRCQGTVTVLIVMRVSGQFRPAFFGTDLLELALCPGDGSIGHRQLAVHDGRQAPGAVPASGACTRPWTPAPSGTWVIRVGSAGRARGFGEPHRNPATPRHGA